MKTRVLYIILFSVVVMLLTVGCKTRSYKNFTTYFNTFYNEQKLMDECEEEFEFQSEKKRSTPKILVPLPNKKELQEIDIPQPTFLKGLRVDKAMRQAVSAKLDSILVKGSKILAKSAKSNYVEPSLFLMAKAYFYKEEWLPSQVKCGELIDKNPTGKYSPDAHLLLATNLLMQGKYDAGITMLSRTVDVAWLNERYDILTQAFNIEAEMALFYGDLEGAIRPYFQAIAQTDDRKQQALWQNALAGILYKKGKYERAEKAFAKVLQYRPDLVTEYESALYRASCLFRIGRGDEADIILSRLDEDGKFEEWKDYVITQRMLKTLQTNDSTAIRRIELEADSLFPKSMVKAAYYYEKGMDAFYKDDYVTARSALAKARSGSAEVAQPSMKVFNFMNSQENYLNNIKNNLVQVRALEMAAEEEEEKLLMDEVNAEIDRIEMYIDSGIYVEKEESNIPAPLDTETDYVPSEQTHQEKIDSIKIVTANQYFELARAHNNIGNLDSMDYYYQKAAEISPLNMEQSSRYIYVYAESIRDTNEWKADSLLNVIVNNQPKTEYGKIALAKLGYTAAFITDTAYTWYNSGYNLMRNKEYDFAKKQFYSVYVTYPDSKYAPKALYAIGYMNEHYLQEYDTASFYYLLLLEKYPNSEYVKELFMPLLIKGYADRGEELPDSLKYKEVAIYTADTSIIHAPYDSTLLSKPPDKDGFSFDDLKDPSKLLEKAKKALQGKFDEAKEAINNPEALLEKAKQELLPEGKLPNLEELKKNLPKLPGSEEKKEEPPVSPPPSR